MARPPEQGGARAPVAPDLPPTVLPAAPVAVPRLAVRMVAAPVPYAEVTIREPVVETSMERLFEQSRGELLRHQPRRVLVDMSEAEVKLSISDLNGLAKLIAGSFVGLVDRFALVLRPADLPPEKFFEPSLIHRGLPTYVTADRNDAIDWLAARPWAR